MVFKYLEICSGCGWLSYCLDNPQTLIEINNDCISTLKNIVKDYIRNIDFRKYNNKNDIVVVNLLVLLEKKKDYVRDIKEINPFMFMIEKYRW